MYSGESICRGLGLEKKKLKKNRSFLFFKPILKIKKKPTIIAQ